MSDAEKVSWLSALAALWGVPLGVYVLVSVMPGRNAAGADLALPWFVAGSTLAYLLILSWRAAYVAGRRAS